jgi:hypothetical protein
VNCEQRGAQAFSAVRRCAVSRPMISLAKSAKRVSRATL